MKRRLMTLFVTCSTLLMVLVLALWGVSYARWIAIGPRDLSWTPGVLSQRGAWLEIKQGRFAFYASHHTEDADIFYPERWGALAPEVRHQLEERFPDEQTLQAAFQDYKASTHSEEFHGWDHRIEPAVYASASTPLYDSLLGLKWGRLAIPAGQGAGAYVEIPAWMLAALLALPGGWWLGRRGAALPAAPLRGVFDRRPVVA